MIFRRAKPEDAEAISALIMSFRELMTIEPSGVGAEKFFAAVSAEAEKDYILSDRYDYLVAEVDGELAGFIATKDRRSRCRRRLAPSICGSFAAGVRRNARVASRARWTYVAPFEPAVAAAAPFASS